SFFVERMHSSLWRRRQSLPRPIRLSFCLSWCSFHCSEYAPQPLNVKLNSSDAVARVRQYRAVSRRSRPECRGTSEPLPFPHVPVLSEGGSHGRQTVKKGTTGPVSYQHERRLRSTLLVSKVRGLARAAQGGRQESRKLGQSGREGAEGQRSFI